MKRYVTLLLSVFTLLCSACATTPASPDGTKDADVEKELFQSARNLEQQIDTNGFRYRDESLEAYLDLVLQRLLPTENLQPFSPHVKVVQSPWPNAFALPNGTIYFHTGMLAIMENEAQLAAIMGHELAHFTGRHALREKRKAEERSSFSRAAEAVMSHVGTILGGDEGGEELKGLAGDIREAWVQAAIKGYSRELETAADVEGLKAMARAGYDPAEAPRIFELLKKDMADTKGREPFFFSTHPKLQERIDNYRGLVAERYTSRPDGIGQSRVTNSDEYSRQTERLLLENAGLDIRSGRIRSAEAAVAKSLSRQPGNARAVFLMGEIRRYSGDNPAAIDAYKQAADLDPAYAEPHRELGFLYFQMKRLDEAFAEFQQYLRLKPDAADIVDVRQHMMTQ